MFESATESGVLMPKQDDDELRHKVVEQYLAGRKMADIVADTGVSAPTVYTWIRKDGFEPVRRARSQPLHAADLMRQLFDAHQEIGRLQERIEQLEQQLQKRRR